MGKLGIRLKSIPEEIKVHENDLKTLYEIKETVQAVKASQQIPENRILFLIKIASLADELCPRKGFARNIYAEQVPWKNLIYLQKLIPKLKNSNLSLLKEFSEKFIADDLNELDKIVNDMIQNVQHTLEYLNKLTNQLQIKQKLHEKWLQEIGQIQRVITQHEDTKKVLQQINGLFNSSKKSSSKNQSLSECYKKIRLGLLGLNYEVEKLSSYF